MINLNNPLQAHQNMSSALFIEDNAATSMRKKTLSQKVEVGVTSLVSVIVVLIAVISLIFLSHSNRNATKGYALKNLEMQRLQLLTENEVWDMEISQIKSLDSIQSDPKILSMRKAEAPKYVRGDTAIAKR